MTTERTGPRETGHDHDGPTLEAAAAHTARFFPNGGPLGALTAQQILDRYAEFTDIAANDETWRALPTPLPEAVPFINNAGEIEVAPIVTGEQYAAAAAFAAAEIELASRRFHAAARVFLAVTRSARVLSETADVLKTTGGS